MEDEANDRKTYPPIKRSRESPETNKNTKSNVKSEIEGTNKLLCETSSTKNNNIINITNTSSTTSTATHHHHHSNNNNNKEQDRFLPIANVGRIMKKVIPGNGKISKDAKETVQECVSEFISFVTGEASDKCQREKRKTINGDDIIWAITTLGFEDYVGPLKSYLGKYREIEGEKAILPKQQQQQQQRVAPQSMHGDATTGSGDHHHQLHHHQTINHHHHQSYDNVVYSSSINNLVTTTPSSFVPTTDHQTFSLNFSPTSIPKHLQQHDELDSVRHW